MVVETREREFKDLYSNLPFPWVPKKPDTVFKPFWFSTVTISWVFPIVTLHIVPVTKIIDCGRLDIVASAVRACDMDQFYTRRCRAFQL